MALLLLRGVAAVFVKIRYDHFFFTVANPMSGALPVTIAILFSKFVMAIPPWI
jgi:hypothetical protein